MTTQTVMLAIVDEQLEILRRIGDRGLSMSRPAGDQDGGDCAQLDLWQHLQDELTRLRGMLGLPTLQLTRALYHD